MILLQNGNNGVLLSGTKQTKKIQWFTVFFYFIISTHLFGSPKSIHSSHMIKISDLQSRWLLWRKYKELVIQNETKRNALNTYLLIQTLFSLKTSSEVLKS